MVYSVRGSSRYNFIVNGDTIAKNAGQGGGRGGFGGFGGGFGGRGGASTTFHVEEGKTYNIYIDLVQPEARSASFSFDIYSRGPVDFPSVIKKIAPADVIIMVSGISSDIEGEGHDRSEIELPEIQQQLLAELDATGKPIVLVNVSGSAIGFGNVESKYDALIQAWYGGQACGEAVGDVLFGNYNPAGRLPVTFYKSTDQLPDFQDYSMNNRTYRYFKGEPLYAFGYGLSYTTFKYGKAKTSGKSQSMTLTVPVTNTGKIDGDEVIQVYVKSLDDAGAPIKSLAGFARVNIGAGQTKTVKIELNKEAFSFYDEATDGLKFRPGRYRIMYGGSSLDSDLQSVELNVKK